MGGSSLLPIISDRSLLGHDRFEPDVLSDQDLAEQALLAKLHRLQAYQFEHGQKHANQRRARFDVAQDLFQTYRLVFQRRVENPLDRQVSDQAERAIKEASVILLVLDTTVGITDEEKYRDEDYSRARVVECLKLVNLAPETMSKFPGQLSGGMIKPCPRIPVRVHGEG